MADDVVGGYFGGAITVAVFDPLLWASRGGPYDGLFLGQEDAILITVEDDPTLTPCQIVFSLEAGPLVSVGKRITGWIPFSATESFSMETGGSNRGPFMHQIARTDGEVIHLQKSGWGRWMDMYMFDRELMWAHWGGRKVTIHWNYDWYYTLDVPWQSVLVPLGPPTVEHPDGTIVASSQPVPAMFVGHGRAAAATRGHDNGIFQAKPVFQTGEEQLHAPPARLLAYIIYGGAKFPIFDNAEGLLVASQGLTPLSQALILPQAEIDALPDTPVDFTLLAEMQARSGGWDIGKRCIVFGGAKFEYTDNPLYPNAVRFPDRWTALAPTPDNFGVKWRTNPISPQHFRDLPKMPHLGTLVREESDPMVFRMGEDFLHHVPNVTEFQNLCLNWDNVRVVPDGSLEDLERSI